MIRCCCTGSDSQIISPIIPSCHLDFTSHLTGKHGFENGFAGCEGKTSVQFPMPCVINRKILRLQLAQQLTRDCEGSRAIELIFFCISLQENSCLSVCVSAKL